MSEYKAAGALDTEKYAGVKRNVMAASETNIAIRGAIKVEVGVFVAKVKAEIQSLLKQLEEARQKVIGTNKQLVNVLGIMPEENKDLTSWALEAEEGEGQQKQEQEQEQGQG